MNTKTIAVNETGHDLNEGRSIIFKIIDSQIDNYKSKYLADWEKDHNISPVEKDQKIGELRAAKEELLQMMKANESEDKEVNFRLKLEVEVAEKQQVPTEEDMLVAN
ncbi:hypothetical protein [Reichenbachiella ulvae]|uniref:Uncharacterized protein n=1 Tax=Reichenbachiella ulvae TaxID=2980104 RepID=A0ABT3CSD0_9BACT|nr:hypothetical protein [Reichenbachiella ulvae]MCV9386620.1 hypothetical protein [Reichenbachiella ulvae]